MKAVRQHVHGRFFHTPDHAALLLQDPAPSARSAASLFLRFAFVTLGREEHIFPAFILDDWGNEIKGLEVYEWVHEFGSQFPRGEIFGFDSSGTDVQLFVRELELYQKLPCYLFTEVGQPLADGRLLDAILLPTPEISQPQPAKRPSDLKRPLRIARLRWWHFPTDTTDTNLTFLRQDIA